jgi:hypothetical protein
MSYMCQSCGRVEKEVDLTLEANVTEDKKGNQKYEAWLVWHCSECHTRNSVRLPICDIIYKKTVLF